MKRELFFFSLFIGILFHKASAQTTLSLEISVNQLALGTPTALAKRLRYQNDLLEFENYQKRFLPSVQLNFNPLSFNRSMRLLQNTYDGNYSNVEDYANTSSLGLSVQQAIGITGGTLSASSDLSLLREFSVNSNSYSTTPFYISYSQSLRGGKRQYKYERMLRNLQRDIAIKEYCTSVSSVQQEILSLYLNAYQCKLEMNLAKKNVQIGDTLVQLAKLKRTSGYITDYDCNQVELQQLENSYTHEHALQNYDEAVRKLAGRLGIADSIILTQPNEEALPALLNGATVIECIRQNNPQTLSQELQRIQAAYAQYKTRLATLFNGTVSLNYGLNQYSETFKAAYTHPNSRQAISVGFSIPAFDWGINRNKRRIAENEYNATLLDLKVIQQNFEDQIKTQINSYNYTVNLYKLAERSYVLAQEQYQLAVNKFAMGKVSVYELTSANKNQYTAMQKYYSSMKSLFTDYYALRHLALYDFVKQKSLEEVFLK